MASPEKPWLDDATASYHIVEQPSGNHDGKNQTSACAARCKCGHSHAHSNGETAFETCLYGSRVFDSFVCVFFLLLNVALFNYVR